MRREMVLNDLCVARQASTLHEARERMALFVLTLVAAIQAGAERSLRCLHSIDATEIAGPAIPVQDGWDIWLQREALFPSLLFCESVAGQLESLKSGDPLVRQILKRLGELNRYFTTWDGARFLPETIPMKITPESSPTLERYGDERLILCPDGVRRLFSWHGRLTPGVWRLYFEPDPVSRKAFIGFIGKKPPGALYQT